MRLLILHRRLEMNGVSLVCIPKDIYLIDYPSVPNIQTGKELIFLINNPIMLYIKMKNFPC